MRPMNYLVTLCLFLIAANTEASENNFSNLENFIATAKNITQMKSATSVILIKNGKVVHQIHKGYSDVENNTPATAETVYYFASTTKAVMALATLMAEYKDMLQESTTLAELFPDIKFKYINPKNYTIKQLISHTSGLSNEAMTWTFSYTGLHDQQQRNYFISTLREHPTIPQGEFNYSNLGYNLMAMWFDRQNKLGWQQALKDLVFDPVGMNKTTSRVSQAKKKNWPIAKPYSYKYQQGEKAIYMNKRDNTLYSVGMFSRANDVANLLTMLMPVNQTSSPFPLDVIKKSQQRLVDGINSYYSGYGWGWQHGKVNEHNVLLHTGGFDGASVQITYSPELNIGVVTVHNESGLVANTLNGQITTLAYELLLGNKQQEKYQRLSEKMTRLATRVKESQLKLANKKAALINKSAVIEDRFPDLAGDYVHKGFGQITIRKITGLYIAIWGDLRGSVYASESNNELLIELRPGKFYPVTLEKLGASQALSYQGANFMKI